VEAISRNTVRLCVCSGERIKLIGSTDGYFPDMGHHIANEMNGMWMHPIKLLDGFWFRLEDHSTNGEINRWIRADKFINHPYGNSFTYTNGLGHTAMIAERFQFSPDDISGCVVKYILTNRAEVETKITCEMLARTDLRPVWLSENIGITDGITDEAYYIEEDNVFLAKDCDNEWYAAIGCDTAPDSTRIGQFFATEITAGNGISVSMTFSLDFKPEETKEIVFYFAGSKKSREECFSQYRALYNHKELLEEKKQRYNEIKSLSELISPNSSFNTIYEWIKANTDWLIINVPGTGRGVTAGLPEYPFWFGCDGCFTIMGLIATGRLDVAKQTMRVLIKASEQHNGNGRIVHEVTTNGVVNNPGNTQETAQFIVTFWEYILWTGDIEFAAECFPFIQKSIKWLKEMDDDDDGFPSGYGVIEVTGMNMELVDTAVYYCVALNAYGYICSLLGYTELAERAVSMAEKNKEAVLKTFWLPERELFADTVTTVEIVKERLSSTLYKWGPGSEPYREYLEAEIATKEHNNQSGIETGWLINESWITATPMEMNLATAKQAETALANLHTDRFLGPYGAYLGGLDKRIMTITSNVYAIAQARYGYSDRALDIIERMFSTFSMATPGSIAEMSPDYGCFVQGWTIYCTPTIVKYFFGIQPDVPAGKIIFSPCMPSAWNKAELKNVQVGNGSISVYFERVNGKDSYRVENKTELEVLENKTGGRFICLITNIQAE